MEKYDDIHDLESYVITIRRKDDTGKISFASPITGTEKPGLSMPEMKQTEAVTAKASSALARTVQAPLPGIIVDLNVKIGDKVTDGQVVAVLEAMKMENDIQAECSGTVTQVHVGKGESVLEGTPIVTITQE
jgi:biotin carboxyl carrier protein